MTDIAVPLTVTTMENSTLQEKPAKAPRKPRRKQARRSLTFSATQYYVLEHMFIYKPYPQFRQPNEYETMAKAIGLEPAQVRIWFQNRRSRRRAKLLKGEEPPPPKHLVNSEGLSEEDLDVMSRDIITYLESVIRPSDGVDGLQPVAVANGPMTMAQALPSPPASMGANAPTNAVAPMFPVKRALEQDDVPSLQYQPQAKQARVEPVMQLPAFANEDQVAPVLVAPALDLDLDLNFAEATHAPVDSMPMTSASPVPSFSDSMDINNFMSVLSPATSSEEDNGGFLSYASSDQGSSTSLVDDFLDMENVNAAMSPQEVADLAF